MMTTTWTIDAVHRAKIRCVISELIDMDDFTWSRYTFLKTMEPYVLRNNIPLFFYSIIEKYGA
jgi:hypothetical protein